MKILGILLISPMIGIILTAILINIIEKIDDKKWKKKEQQSGCLFITLFIAGMLLILLSK